MPEETGRLAREARAAAELFALCGFAITQPLLDVFGRAVEQLALRAASAAQIVGFGIGVTVLPTAALWLGEVLIGMVSARARRVAHAVVLVLLVAGFVVQVARPLATGILLAVLATVAGIAASLGYTRTRVVRLWLELAAVAPVGFLALFLVASPAADLLGDGTSGTGVEVGRPAPVVMLVLDEVPLGSLLRADGTIDAELFPSFARLAADSHWFRNTTTVTPSTWHSLPTILTGQVPEHGDGPGFPSHPDSLFSLLSGRYEMRVIESVTRLCPPTVCRPRAGSGEVWSGLADDAWDVLQSRLSLTGDGDDPVAGFSAAAAPENAPPTEFGGGAGLAAPARFRSLVEDLDDGLALHYLHLLLPHVPYRYLPSGNTYDGPNPDLGRVKEPDRWGDEPWPVSVTRQRHLLQLAYVDGLLGELLTALEDEGVYDDALVVVTADHGVSFEPGGPARAIQGQGIDEHTTPDVLWVPFFVKEPGQAAGDVSDANVQLIDVVPTMADVLDISIPFPVDGRSALGPARTTTDKPFYGSDFNASGPALEAPVTVDGEVGWAAVLERSVGRFLPPSGGQARLWQLGPAPELVGKPFGELPPGALDRLASTLLTPNAFTDVPESGELPALVRGTLADAAPGDPIAVIVNGVVAATGLAYRDGDAVAFAAMVSDELLQAGANEVAVFAIR